MQPNDFDYILGSARQLREAVASIYKDVTGEDLDIEGAIRHYPVIALGLTAGAAAVAGWYFGRRNLELPPPAPQPALEVEPSPLDRVRQILPNITVAPDVAAAARSWFSSVVEPALRENLDGAMRSFQESGFSGFLDSAAGLLDSKRDVHLPDGDDEDPKKPR